MLEILIDRLPVADIPEHSRPLCSKRAKVTLQMLLSGAMSAIKMSNRLTLPQTKQAKFMAGTIIDMSKIKQLLQLKKAGVSNWQTAKDLKMIMVKVIAVAKNIMNFWIWLPVGFVYSQIYLALHEPFLK